MIKEKGGVDLAALIKRACLEQIRMVRLCSFPLCKGRPCEFARGFIAGYAAHDHL